MRRSSKLVSYGALSAAFFLLALVLGRPELAALGAPFALVLVVGLASPRPAPVEVALEVEQGRVFEGDEFEAGLVVRQAGSPRASGGASPAYVSLSLPRGVRPADGDATFVLALGGEERRIPVRLVADRWGGYRLGDAVWRAGDTAGLIYQDGGIRGDSVLQVYPRVERMRALVNPFETQPFVGNRVSRARGEGIEFADTRPWAPGDRPRRVNWRATSRRQMLYVNEQQLERSSDVVIFVDSFAEARHEQGSTLDLAVRAAVSLAQHYLATRDRVGLVSFGGLVRWLRPGAGEIQRYRIIEALLETEVAFSFAWKDIDAVPVRSLTPQALVIALTPLLDERGLNALLDLRRRGFDLVVVEMSPVAFAAGGLASRDALATRFWLLWRDAMRFRFERLGVAVVEWDGTVPLTAAIEEVRAFRRFARFASG
jgi:uncharacterized protein (DUF58 family)